MLFLLFIGFAILGFAVQSKLKSKFKKYSSIPTSSGLSGREVAELMLHQNEIYDVKVVSIPGQLTDHYNPTNKTINLSPEVYSECSVISTAIAAHECGHALQHAKAYAPLKMRSTLVPIVSISSRLLNFIFLFGLFGFGYLNLFSMNTFAFILIGAQAIITLFTLITLPVEFDASHRALQWIDNAGIVGSQEEFDAAADGLKWAGRTYIVAALAAVTTLLYYLLSFLGGGDD